jgi:hypothetical protein
MSLIDSLKKAPGKTLCGGVMPKFSSGQPFHMEFFRIKALCRGVMPKFFSKFPFQWGVCVPFSG